MTRANPRISSIYREQLLERARGSNVARVHVPQFSEEQPGKFVQRCQLLGQAAPERAKSSIVFESSSEIMMMPAPSVIASSTSGFFASSASFVMCPFKMRVYRAVVARHTSEQVGAGCLLCR
jgi:hypothetical protein